MRTPENEVRPDVLQHVEPRNASSPPSSRRLESRMTVHPNPSARQAIIARVEPDGEPFVVSGREAQTLDLLIQSGDAGFTSGEASPLGWARRTSDYVLKLRRKGVPVSTTRERAGDAVVGRYRLAGRVRVLSEGEAA